MSGFLPFGDASFMMDFVVVAMALVIPGLFIGIRAAKNGNLKLHKQINGTIAIVLIIAVVAFEIDVRFWGWRQYAEDSPYYPTTVITSLIIHLVFAVTSLILLLWTIIGAWRKFPSPPAPNEHSKLHRLLGKLTFIDLCCTTITGWTFYYLAFVATKATS